MVYYYNGLSIMDLVDSISYPTKKNPEIISFN